MSGEKKMNLFLTDIKYDDCRRWIKKARDNGKDWGFIDYAGKGSDEGLYDFLKNRIDNDFWPEDLTLEMWHEIVKDKKDAEEKKLAMQRASKVAELSDLSEDAPVGISEDEHSCWQLYRKHLLEDSKFSTTAVDNIQDSCYGILKRLRSDTSKTGPVQGLVIGNVQSGKTANMAGLMAMAADCGYNFFIVLSGTIENLRKQTQKRLFEDLNQRGNIQWFQFDHLSKKNAVVGQRTSDLDFSDGNTTRYMTVCLKVQSRLKDLIDWIESDKNQTAKMKVLVIDDEADQGGINTADIYTPEERKTINKLIVNLVKCRDKKSTTAENNKFMGHYKAMNYISYTATPYANCLNDSSEDSLYPRNFIRSLPLSKEYFGPQQIFGLKDAESKTLDVVREVSDSDVEEIKNIQSNGGDDIPDSLKEAIEWFFCCASIMRYYDYKKPVSMLIHTSQKQGEHENIKNAIVSWFEHSNSRFVSECRELYERETNEFTKRSLREVYADYDNPDSNIWNYPEFDDLIPYIEEITEKITSIYMDSEGDLNYSKSIHLCVDNCANNGTDNDGMYMRLSYPDPKSEKCPDYSTAFIVIGGNTLSRGLTLEGLVSTYFLRSSSQADTLMQMGRWFGYRRKYELLPRIWMPKETIAKFQYLSYMDYDLRDQLYEMYVQGGKTPMEFQPAFMLSPLLKLTSKNKMQSAVDAEVDYSGMDTQLTVFSKDNDRLQRNISATENFLKGLGEGEMSENSPDIIWRNISFEDIKKNLFDKNFKVPENSRAFYEIELLTDWIKKATNEGKMGKWNVIVAGIKTDNKGKDSIWTLPDGHEIGKVSRTVRNETADTVNIGVLSTKRDYVADIKLNQLDDASWLEMKNTSAMNANYKQYRINAGYGNTPLFIIYRLNKYAEPTTGTHRMKMDLQYDPIGITMVTPGVRDGNNTVKRIKISITNPIDEEDEI